MFRLNKLTDYALVVMQYVASHPEEPRHTARGLAEATELPAPTVVKILKELLDHQILVSHRGAKGGYAPARLPSEISVAEIVEAFEGSIGFTECATSPGRCELEGRCNVQSSSAVIGRALEKALAGIRLADLAPGPNGAAGKRNRNQLVAIGCAAKPMTKPVKRNRNSLVTTIARATAPISRGIQ